MISEKKRRAGKAAHAKKIGIHSYSPEKLSAIRQKGNKAFIEKWQSEEFRKLHSDRIKEGIKTKRQIAAMEKEKYFGFR